MGEQGTYFRAERDFGKGGGKVRSGKSKKGGSRRSVSGTRLSPNEGELLLNAGGSMILQSVKEGRKVEIGERLVR